MATMVNKNAVIRAVEWCYRYLPVLVHGERAIYGVEVIDPTTLNLTVDVGGFHTESDISFSELDLVCVGHDLNTTHEFESNIINHYLFKMHYYDSPDDVVFRDFDQFAEQKDAVHVIAVDDGSGEPAYKCPYCGLVYHSENFFDMGERSQTIWCDRCDNLIRLELGAKTSK